MELIYNYMEDDILRHKLNTLTQKTFGFDFENWVMDGYFEGHYIPYSFMEDGKILSNVSVNRMRFIQNGVQKNYIQIGTVMTDESYRKRGLARRLMGRMIIDCFTGERNWKVLRRKCCFFRSCHMRNSTQEFSKTLGSNV